MNLRLHREIVTQLRLRTSADAVRVRSRDRGTHAPTPLFDEQGNILLPHLWPDELANSVEAVDVKAGKVKLASKSTARRIILEQTGKLKAPSILHFDHAAYLGAEPPTETE
jgi:hypothetical protein